MEHTKKSTLHFLLPYALGLLVIRLLMDTLIKQLELGYQGESYGSFVALFIELSVVFVAIRNYKTFQNNNQLLFSEGVKIGVGLVLIMGTLFSVYIFLIHANFIDPDYQQKIVDEAVSVMSKNNPQADTTSLTKEAPSSFTGLAFWILKYAFIGALGGIVSAAILKTE
ncbi:DUF4199 domain-containing protein [Aquimarina agarivorans]|uniref:DUF4199 domain-containing protein n=1 Tax=Aquimarina agarivorans TaxID=980584 RepID=UPI000248E8BA|nr:DUF4199 domain-containing protein [Aquimarina agarivorans]